MRLTYDNFASEHPHAGFCWACGRTCHDQPTWWHAPWLLERVHICNKPRREDIRVIVLLDSACHKASHGERFRKWGLPKLTLPNLLHLKLVHDSANWDRAFMQRCSVQILPDAEPLPEQYAIEYERCHAISAMRERAALIRAGTLPQPVQRPGESDTSYLLRLRTTAAAEGRTTR